MPTTLEEVVACCQHTRQTRQCRSNVGPPCQKLPPNKLPNSCMVFCVSSPMQANKCIEMKIPENSLIYIYHFYSRLTYPPPSDPTKQSEIVFGFHVSLCNYLRTIHLIKNCVSKFSPRKRSNDSHSRPSHRSLQRHAERCLLPHPATATATNADAFPLSLHRAEGKTI